MGSVTSKYYCPVCGETDPERFKFVRETPAVLVTQKGWTKKVFHCYACGHTTTTEEPPQEE